MIHGMSSMGYFSGLRDVTFITIEEVNEWD